VLHAGTYNASTIAIAAVIASIDLLSQPGTYERLFARAERLMQGMARIFEAHGITVQVQGVGPMFQMWFSETPIHDYRDAASHLNSPKYAALARALHERGVMVHPSNIELWFVSTVHSEEDIDATLEAFEGAVKATETELKGR
jgi:glutamate-1-semialdehyde 2,1-aminomutase